MPKWIKIGIISCLSALIISIGLVLFTKIYFDNTRNNHLIISDNSNNNDNNGNLNNDQSNNDSLNSNDNKPNNNTNNDNILTNISLLNVFNKYDFLSKTTNYQSFFNDGSLSFDLNKIKSNLYNIMNDYVIKSTKVDLNKNTLNLKVYFQTLNNYKEIKIYLYWTIKPLNSLLQITKKYYDSIYIIIK